MTEQQDINFLRQKRSEAAAESKIQAEREANANIFPDAAPLQSKPLPYRKQFKRGDQGTFVYSPDIQVLIYTDEYGVIDLGPFVTNFQVNRVVNNISTFSCTFDNKFRRYDRVIRRMNRIAVFLKRVNWMQVFAGYVTDAPWETVVPGDAQLTAQCTMKRLAHTYWDAYSAEAMELYPMTSSDGAFEWDNMDGAANVVFKLMVEVAKWDPRQIWIQKIPDEYIKQIQKILSEEDKAERADRDFSELSKSIQKLIDYHGWNPKAALDRMVKDESDGSSSGTVDGDWQAGKTNGKIPLSSLTKVSGITARPLDVDNEVLGNSGDALYLREDAAFALQQVIEYPTIKNDANADKYLQIEFSYLTLEKQQALFNSSLVTETGSTDKMVTQPQNGQGTDPSGWGTAVFFANRPPDWMVTVLTKYGWSDSGNGHTFIFGGSEDAPDYLPGTKPAASTSDTPSADPETDTVDEGQADASITNAMFFWPEMQGMTDSSLFTGDRAWVNDVPLIQALQPFAQATNRDFMSSPDGDFVMFFPDRMGLMKKFPAVEVRDIEVLDFKMAINDTNLATHLFSAGNLFAPADPQANIDINAFTLGTSITVEMEVLMKYLFGFEDGQDVEGMGEFMLKRFGIRPRREDQMNIRDRGWLFIRALHRFQELWASQWSVPVQFTFMPEIFPGMRIELIDHGLAVYVEAVTHSGSRTGGFVTQVQISTPMRRDGDRWVMLRAEYPAGPSDVAETKPTNQAEPATYQNKIDAMIQQGRF